MKVISRTPILERKSGKFRGYLERYDNNISLIYEENHECVYVYFRRTKGNEPITPTDKEEIDKLMKEKGFSIMPMWYQIDKFRNTEKSFDEIKRLVNKNSGIDTLKAMFVSNDGDKSFDTRFNPYDVKGGAKVFDELFKNVLNTLNEKDFKFVRNNKEMAFLQIRNVDKWNECIKGYMDKFSDKELESVDKSLYYVNLDIYFHKCKDKDNMLKDIYNEKKHGMKKYDMADIEGINKRVFYDERFRGEDINYTIQYNR